MRCLASLPVLRQQSSKKQKDGAGVAVVKRAEVVAAALAKEGVMAPAASSMVSSPQGAEVHPQEVPMPSVGLTPPAPILAVAAEVAQSLEPSVLPAVVASSVLTPRASSPLPGM